MTLYDRALIFAKSAHESIDQRRKYTNDPYINHPRAVAALVKQAGYGMELQAAALLHDVVEDVKTIFIHDIEKEFGVWIARIVDGLTDVYTHEAFPNIARKERKLLECYRLWQCSSYVKTVKLADLIDNTSSIVDRDPGFAKTYLCEKEEYLKVLQDGDDKLYGKAMRILKESKAKIFI